MRFLSTILCILLVGVSDTDSDSDVSDFAYVCLCSFSAL